MRHWIIALIALGAFSFQGCTYVPGIEPTDLSAVQKEAATKTEVEAVLGDPLDIVSTDEGLVHIYAYDTGAEGGIRDLGDIGYSGGAGQADALIIAVAVPGMLVMTPFFYDEIAKTQRRFAAIIYAQDGSVEAYRLGGIDASSAPDRMKAHLEEAEVVRNLELQARSGDADAQYNLGARSRGRKESWRWFCLAANNGNAKAQYEIGRFYELGRDPVSEDLVAALTWYKLASLKGYQHKESGNCYSKSGVWTCKSKFSHERVASRMTQAETTRAELLVTNWKPNTSECEIIDDLATN